MKNKSLKRIIYGGIAAVLGIATISFSAVAISSNDVKEVNATLTNHGYESGDYQYYTGTYYDSSITDAMVSSGGTTLLSGLCSLIQPSSKFGYDNLWNLYKTSDVYPSDYDGTDSLTGNAYPTTKTASGYRGKIWDMYGDTQYTAGGSAQGANYSKVGDSYNREHTVPQSWFSESAIPQSDPHHIFATDGYVNNQRGNYPYGKVNGTPSAYVNAFGGTGSPVSTYGSCGSSTVFEPEDAYKGDFARAVLYMAAAYYSFSTASFASSNSCFTRSGNNNILSSYYRNLLTKWSNDDPVSQKEIDRNNVIYNSSQKNRNPFIDHPNWAYKIWGGTQYTWNNSGSSSSDPSASILPASPSVAAGSTVNLTATLSNVTSASNITWTSSDESIATVAKGTTSTSSSAATVTGVAAGTATIYCIHSETNIGSVTVTVTSGSTASGDYTFTAGTDTGTHTGSTGDQGEDSITKSGVTMSTTNGALAASSQYRIYSGATLTFTCDSNITSIVLTGNETKPVSGLSAGSGSYSVSNNVGTWTGSSTSVTFTASAQVRFSPVTVTVTSSSSSSASISLDKAALSLTVGGSTGSLSATIANGSGDVSWSSSPTGVVSISTSGTNNKNATVTASAAGSTTITATYSGVSATCSVTVSAAATTYTVTYNSNGADSGSVPTDNTSYASGATVTVKGNTGSLAKSGYDFSGWTTNSGGTGTVYAAGGSYTITANTTFYAKWTASSGGTTSYEFDRINSTSDLTNGEYLIVSEDNNVALNGGLTSLDATSNTITVSPSNGVIASNSTTNAATFTYNSSETTLKSASGYYIGATSNSNVLHTSTSIKYKNTISFSDDDADVVGSGGAYLRYNKASDQARFKYFKSSSYSGQQAIQLYKKVESSGSSSTTDTITISGSNSVNVGSTITLTATHSGTDTVSWSTSSASIASIPDNSTGTSVVVTGVDAGTTTITASCAGGGSDSITITVNAVSSGNEFKLVSSTSELIAGAKVIIAGEKDSSYYVAKAWANGNNLPSVTGSLSNNILTLTTNYQAYTIGISNGNYTFSYTSGNSTYYLYNASSTKSYLKAKETTEPDTTCEWTISISDSTFTIENVGNTTKPLMKLNYNNGTPIFNCYASDTTGMYNVQLYADVTAGVSAFATGFLHPEYTGDGTGLCLGESGYYYTAKRQLVAMGSAYITEFQENPIFDDYQTKYQTWASKNGDSSPYVIPSSGSAYIDNNDTNAGLITTVATLIVSTVALGSFFLLKKKKQIGE